jgi:hypothetical protein
VRFPCFTARFLCMIEQARPNRLVQTLIFQVLRVIDHLVTDLLEASNI